MWAQPKKSKLLCAKATVLCRHVAQKIFLVLFFFSFFIPNWLIPTCLSHSLRPDAIDFVEVILFTLTVSCTLFCYIFVECMCREGKIPDLSQADTSYYWVHKIQPITKHHVLLLGFTITTQKPTEICQVSCKNQSHLSTCKRWHKQPRTCKRWHKQARTCKQWHKQSSHV